MRTDSRSGGSFPALAGWILLALCGALGLAVFALRHPFGVAVGGGIAIAFLALMSVRRDAWLLCVPALTPMVDLAGWSGAIHLTESDALVMSALLAGSVQAMPAASGRMGVAVEAGGGRAWRFGVIQIAVVGLLGLSYLVSTQWSAMVVAARDAALWMGYGTALNGPRVAKGFVWAVLLLPLLAQALRDRPQAATRCLVWGLVAGAVLVSLAAVWERWAFTGLSDFASDYRTTALFWEMNVGGATLDGWLALTVPVALWWVLRQRDVGWEAPVLCIGLAVLGLLAYASFTTFSRGLYLGLAVGVVVLLLAMLRRGTWRVSVTSLLAWLVYAAVLLWLLAAVFQTGGYRGAGAMLGLALAVFGAAPVVAVASAHALGGAVVLVLAAAAASVAAMLMIPKGVYLAYALNAVLLGAALFSRWPGGLERWATGVRIALLGWLAVNAVLVSQYWAESGGVLSALFCVLWLLLPLAWVHIRPARCWRPTPHGWVLVSMCLGAITIAVVSLNTYYAATRMERAAADLEGRLGHWSYAASLPSGQGAQWLGVGVGRFAEAYFWQAPEGVFPGSHGLGFDAGNPYLKLGAPRHVLGFGELYRVSQRVSPGVVAPLQLAVRARAPEADAHLNVEVCRKHLLYEAGCAAGGVRVPKGAAWTTQHLVLDPGRLGGSGSVLPRLTVFSIANDSRALLEVDDISLVDGHGRELLGNGHFARGADRWFFTSDRHHLPWHAKNLWLHFFVEQGWLGLAAFSLLCAAALFRLTLGRGAAHPLAPPLLGGLTAFFIVGAFDSLVDAPRLAMLAFLLMFTALGVRGARGRQASIESVQLASGAG